MNNKTVKLVLAGVGLGIGVLLSSIGVTQAAQFFYPYQGGTGTSTAPSYGQMLVGNGAGVYQLMATSSLGLGGGGSGTVTSVDMTVPTGLSIGGNPITTAGTLTLTFTAGYNIPLTASTTNWNTFYDTPSTRITAGTNLSWSGNTLNATAGSGSGNVSTSTNEVAGYLAYWTSNSATPALLGQVATGTIAASGGITVTAGQSIIGSGLTVGCSVASGSQAGCISTGDWTVFNNKISSTSITATSPIFWNSATGVISSQAANVAQDGYLTSADWSTFNSKQSAISVTWPVTLSGATVGFGGLSTSTAAVIGNIPYFSSVNTFANVATSALTATAPLSLSQPISVIGSAASALSISTAGDWTGTLDGYEGTTLFSGKVSTSSIPTTGRLAYWTDNGTPSLLGDVATGTVSGASIISLTAGQSVIGSGLTITTTGGTFGAGNYVFPSELTVNSSTSLQNVMMQTATTSNLVISGITGSTQCLHVNTLGQVSGTGSDCGAGGGGAAYDWQKETNYGALTLTPTTTIPIWIKDNIYASSSVFVSGTTTSLKSIGVGRVPTVNAVEINGSIDLYSYSTITQKTVGNNIGVETVNNSAGSTGGITINTGNYTGSGSVVPTSGNITITTGNSTGGANNPSPGSITLKAGNASADGGGTSPIGGSINITGGDVLSNSSRAGGSINITSGSNLNPSWDYGPGGNIVLKTGTGTTFPGSILFTTGSIERGRFLGSDGNFGIGTTSPYAKLSVVGEIVGAYFTSTTTASSTFTNFTTTNNASTSKLWVSSLGTAAGTFLAVDPQGLVIATATPTGGGSGTVNSGSQYQTAFYATAGTAVSGTSTIVIKDERVGIMRTPTANALEITGNIDLYSATALSNKTVNNALTISTVDVTSGNAGAINIQGGNATGGSTDGANGSIVIDAGDATGGTGGPDGGTVTISGGNITQNIGGYGGTVTITSGSVLNNAGNTAGNLNLTGANGYTAGSVILTAGTGTGSNGSITFTLNGSEKARFLGSNGNFGIGTTSPYAKLSVVGEIVGAYFTGTTTATSTLAGGLRTNLLNVISSTASSTFANGINVTAGCFSVNGTCVGGSALSGGAANKVAYWTGASALSNNTNFHWDNTNARLGLGTTSPYAMLSVAGTGVFKNIEATSTTATSTIFGGLTLGSTPDFQYDFSSKETTINALTTGPMSFDNDAGIVSFVNLPFASTTMAASTPMSYSMLMHGTSTITVYGEHNGSGGAQNIRVGIGTTSPSSFLHVEDIYATTTVSISSGVASKGGRIILEDIDGAGCTQVFALNGVLTAEIVTCPTGI